MKNYKFLCKSFVIIITVILISVLFWYIINDSENNEITGTTSNSVSSYNNQPDINVLPSSINKPIDEQAGDIQFEKYTLDDIPDELLKAPPGVIIAQERTDAIIARLSNESMEDSLINLDSVGDFYYPGYLSPVFGGEPFDTVQKILSNRRFIKLYEELKARGQNEQYEFLHNTLNDKLSQYHKLLSRYSDANLPAKEYLDLSRINDVPGLPRTRYGTMFAIESIALLSGVLGNVKMWPELQELFNYPVIGREMSKDEFNPDVLTLLNNSPLFPTGFQMQVIWLLSQYSEEDEAGLYQLDINKVKAIVPENMIKTKEIQNYQSSVTQYDLNFLNLSKPIDHSYGSHTFRFLVIDNPLFSFEQRTSNENFVINNMELFEQLIKKYCSVENK